MNSLKTAGKIISLFLLIIYLSCASPGKKQSKHDTLSSGKHYTIYVVNNNLHTGILIPVISESAQTITALKNFSEYKYTDFGWGEENVYQSPVDTFCMDAKAILLVNSSVVRVEGHNESIESIVRWSDFTVKFSLTVEQFQLLCKFINDSFFQTSGSEPVISSEKSSGRIIFFRSVHNYHLFNTCNTWVANALEFSGLEVSGSVIITASGLYKAIKDHGTVLKPLQ